MPKDNMGITRNLSMESGIFADESNSKIVEALKEINASINSLVKVMVRSSSDMHKIEGTSNIDTNTEQLIQKSVDIISKDKTSIFIAHRLSTIVNVDKIIVLDHGTIIETGNHIQLLKKGGYYSNLYNAYYASLG